MAKKYVLAGVVAAFLAAANIAYAPITKGELFIFQKPNLERTTMNIFEKKYVKEQEFEKIVKRAREESRDVLLSDTDKIYGFICNVYKNQEIQIPNYITKKLVRTQIWAESRDYRKAIGKDGERGLMQPMPETWKRIKPKLDFKKNAFNPQINIYVGVKHLIDVDKELQRRNSKWNELGDEEKMKLVAAAYNCGVGRLAKTHYNIDKTPERTRKYIKDIEGWMSGKYAEY